ncbi:hypothetical protein GH714_022391 [Hevea brasiliensis]|uniref:Uncharacterized protein n=1 Tax=Hevea brasiliensis TaxID=3981 RepID=A0A6A6M2R4_HEVBR|nr:hypothetical protein GH714_022391 [Hevea brasiliensis]
MLAWEMPSSRDEESRMECEGKAREDGKIPPKVAQEEDEIPLFYSDVMPLLVNDEPSVGEDAFVWLAALVPFAADVVNGRFTFETLTAPTGNRLFFPAYDKFLKEIAKYEHTVKPTATGPWGAPLFDKAIIYESPELYEGIVLEFPEMTSSTRRDHWLALTKEVMLMNQFLSENKLVSSIEVTEADKERTSDQDSIHLLESAINQARKEAKDVEIAKATAEG